MTSPNAFAWASIHNAPVAAAIGAGHAALAFPAPTNPMGPFTFIITQTNTSTGIGNGPVVIVSEAIDANNNLSFVIGNLIIGAIYQFSVEAVSNVFQTTAYSAASNAIMAA